MHNCYCIRMCICFNKTDVKTDEEREPTDYRVNKLSEPIFTSYHARDVNKWFGPMFDPRAMERSAEWEGKAGLQPSCTWGDKMKGSETLKKCKQKRLFHGNLSYPNLKITYFSTSKISDHFWPGFWPKL